MTYWEPVSRSTYTTQAPEEFLLANNFSKVCQVSRFNDIAYMLSTGRYSRISNDRDCPPYLDHACIYKNQELCLQALVYLPSVTTETLYDEVHYWAKHHGLVADIYEHSWFDTHHCTVIIHSPDFGVAFNRGMVNAFYRVD